MTPSRRSLAWRPTPFAAALVALVLISASLRTWAAERVQGPWIAPDETIYWLLGRGLWQHGGLSILGGPTPYFSALYPAFVGLPLSLGGLTFGYSLLKLLQALVMSSAALPVYFWGRSLMGRGWALLAAALTLAVPGLAYSGLVMTEVLFYPLLTLAAWAMAAALARPTTRAQVLVVLAFVACASVRLQAIILLPVFLLALALDCALSRSLVTARRLWPAPAAMSGIVVLWSAARLAASTPILGGYARVGSGSYGAVRGAKFVLYHLASAELLTGIFPVCALILLLVEGLRRGERSTAARAYLAIACSLLLLICLQVGIFASEYVGRLAERDLLALAPTLFLGFALWLSRGGPRPYLVTVGVVLAAAALLLTLPLSELVVKAAPPDALTLVPLLRLRQETSLHTFQTVFAIAVGAVVLLFALLPRRALLLLPALLLVGGAAVSVEVSGYVAEQARAARATFAGSTPGWVDRRASGPVAYVYDGEPEWVGAWQTLFWNPGIDRVYDLEQSKLFGPAPQHPLVLGKDGVLRVPSNPHSPVHYAVIERSFALGGTPIAAMRQSAIGQSGLRLWKYEPPMRLVYRTAGLLPYGDIPARGDGIITAYDCRYGGSFILTLLIKSPGKISIVRDGRLWRKLSFRPRPTVGVWRGQIPVRPHTSGFCRLDVRPAGLTGTTVFVFRPAAGGRSK